MTPNYNKVHLKFKINRIHYTYDDLMEVAYSFVKEGEDYEQAIGAFLLDWLDGNDYINVKTSGSTGQPKIIKLKKQSMVNSALATGDFFNLKPGDKALFCLPADYVAGKLMIIRAIILGLELDTVKPTSYPIFDSQHQYDFCAMVPIQLQNCKTYCNTIKTIIVGGAPVSSKLKKSIINVESNVYESYGMTETVSHIALKKLNNFDSENKNAPHFKVLPHISVSQDDRGCLVVDAPTISEGIVVTNDIIKLYSETEFEWVGRFDNVINSGGIKLFPEQIEAKLHEAIESRFFIASQPHDILGEQLILVLESELNEVDDSIFNELDKYEIPKVIYAINTFTETALGKIHRKKTLEAALLA